MLFNSLGFALFLPVVFILYWFVARGSLRSQNLLLLFSSYYFYGCWDKRFLLLLVFSTLLDYLTGIKIFETSERRKKLFWLWLSVGINLGFLCVFKYYNFFASSFADAISTLGFQPNLTSLQIILPVGISFYTFHGLSYVFDLYNNKIKPERNFVNYAVFVSFFPLLVAGPIERATHLLPQLIKKREFNYLQMNDGLRQILWGLFKKVVIADNCAQFVNVIFLYSDERAGSTLLVGAFFFAIQIYCDFSGYSDIALGTARLFGIELLRNFAFPYFSRNVAEFWRRWHISLTSWFRDYLYIPLGGSKGGKWMKTRNIFIIFLVSGFWHGASWTFIAWGFLNALFLLPSVLSNSHRDHLDIVAKGKVFPTVKEFLSMLSTFTIIMFTSIFFRSPTIEHAITYVSRIFSESIFSPINFSGMENMQPVLILVFFFILIEWIGREQQYAIAQIGKTWHKSARWSLYYCIIICIYWFTVDAQEFIYFQF